MLVCSFRRGAVKVIALTLALLVYYGVQRVTIRTISFYIRSRYVLRYRRITPIIPARPVAMKPNVLGSGTVVLLIPLTSKAPMSLLGLSVHVFPPSSENAAVPEAPTLFCIQAPSILLLGNGTSQYCVPACN